MDLNDTPQQAEFRQRVRAWLQEHKAHAPEARSTRAGAEDDAYVDARRRWQGQLAEGGLAGVTWPADVGGQGQGPIEQVIVSQEIARAGVPGILDVIGVGMLGPTIIAHGTEEQKGRYLGPMLHGDEVWCQLFSEPAAGSDLAAVQTRARHEDDGTWVLNGQKVWTTNAQFAAFGLLLARTDPEQHKHKGLTMFVLPMDAEGVTVRGLRQISGEAEFNEVFLDDVRAARRRRRRPGQRRLAHRADHAHVRARDDRPGLRGHGLQGGPLARAIAADPDARRDPEIRKRLGEIAVDLLAIKFTGYRTLTALAKGQIPGPEAGLAKVTTVNAAIAAGELIADVLGPDALDEDDQWAYMISFLPG